MTNASAMQQARPAPATPGLTPRPRLQLLLGGGAERPPVAWHAEPRGLGTSELPPALQRVRDDDWLAARVGQLRPEPFGVLFERYWKPVFGYCLAILRSHDKAEDAAQETMTRAYAALARGDVQPRFRPWIFSIARNASIDRIRAHRCEDLLEDQDDLGTVGGPEESAELRERVAQLIADLGALSERQRSALVLRELSGMSHVEIGELLETTPLRTKALIAEARQTLHQRMDGREADCSELHREVLAFGRRRTRGHRLSAHLEVCGSCRTKSGRRALGLLPLPWIVGPLRRGARRAIDLLGLTRGAGSALALKTATVAVTGVAAVAGTGVAAGHVVGADAASRAASPAAQAPDQAGPPRSLRDRRAAARSVSGVPQDLPGEPPASGAAPSPAPAVAQAGELLPVLGIAAPGVLRDLAGVLQSSLLPSIAQLRALLPATVGGALAAEGRVAGQAVATAPRPAGSAPAVRNAPTGLSPSARAPAAGAAGRALAASPSPGGAPAPRPAPQAPAAGAAPALGRAVPLRVPSVSQGLTQARDAIQGLLR